MFSASKTAGPSGYNITNSLRFRSSASAYLSRSFSASSTDRKLGTISMWVKRGKLATQQCIIDSYDGSSTGSFNIYFLSGDTIVWRFGGGAAYANTTSAVYRDPSAWYHIVFVWDTTQATDTNRMKLYVNGVQQTFASTSYPPQNSSAQFPQNGNTKIGCNYNASGEFIDTYFAEYYFIDGQALTPSSFGSTNATTGVWQPAKYTGTYGTNGFYLPFSDIATTSGSNAGLGKDFSGNSNYWTTNNISVTSGTTYDAMTDSPTLTSATVANYCTWNPLFNPTNKTFSDGNLKFVNTTSTVPALSTIGVRSGKWYGEFTFPSDVSNMNIGLAKDTLNKNSYVGADINGVGLFSGNGNLYYNGTGTAYGSSFTSGDIIMIAFDANNGKIWWGKNGTWFNSGNPASGTNPGVASSGATVNITMDFTQEWFFGSGTDVSNGCIANFGQRPFSYTPPTGFVRLNTYNLPNSTVVKGNSYMNAVLYTGDGTTRTVSNLGFTPDFVWTKSRSNATSHILCDRVRGNYLGLYSDLTAAEGYNNYTQFNAAGSNSYNQLDVNNANAYTYVNWIWKADNTSGSSNTDGNVTSTVSVNTTAGFSIVTYTVTSTASMTIGHGLGAVPKMIIEKTRGSSANWDVYTESTGNTGRLQLNLTSAFQTQAGVWNNTTPTSTVFSQQGNGGWHAVGTTCVAYCWAEIAGFSKFGSYTGNGSTDGPFIYLGFRPKFVLLKNASAAFGWTIWDTSRNTYNVVNNYLIPNAADAEGSLNVMDILSNGFKIRDSNIFNNGSGNTLIYAAFAENPFKNALAR